MIRYTGYRGYKLEVRTGESVKEKGAVVHVKLWKGGVLLGERYGKEEADEKKLEGVMKGAVDRKEGKE